MINVYHLNADRWARKASDWNEAPRAVNPEVINAASKLPVCPASDSPLDTRMGRGRFYVALLPNGQRFLVNTEGYNYARYISELPRQAPPTPPAPKSGVKTYTVRVRRTVIHEHVIHITGATSKAQARADAIEQADEKGDIYADTSFGSWRAVSAEVQ